MPEERGSADDDADWSAAALWAGADGDDENAARRA